MITAVQILCIIMIVAYVLGAIASFENKKAALQYMLFATITLGGLIYLVQ